MLLNVVPFLKVIEHYLLFILNLIILVTAMGTSISSTTYTISTTTTPITPIIATFTFNCSPHWFVFHQWNHRVVAKR